MNLRERIFIDDKITMNLRKEKNRESSLEFKREHPVYIRKYNRKYRLGEHGITSEEYNNMYDEQKGKCAICGIHRSKLKKNLSIDHDHSCCNGTTSCGKCIRGLLCGRCNSVLGFVGDSIGIIDKLKAYLIKYNKSSFKENTKKKQKRGAAAV